MYCSVKKIRTFFVWLKRSVCQQDVVVSQWGVPSYNWRRSDNIMSFWKAWKVIIDLIFCFYLESHQCRISLEHLLSDDIKKVISRVLLIYDISPIHMKWPVRLNLCGTSWCQIKVCIYNSFPTHRSTYRYKYITHRE